MTRNKQEGREQKPEVQVSERASEEPSKATKDTVKRAFVSKAQERRTGSKENKVSR